MSIYQEIILDHYQNPRNNRKLKAPTAAVHVANPLCGDELDMEVVIRNNQITEIGFTLRGCAISTAAASLLSEYATGKSKDEVAKLDQKYVLELLGIELSPNRIKCALLPWEALMKVLNK